MQAFAIVGRKHLILVNLNEKGLQETIQECQSDATKVTTHVVDIRDDKAVEALVEDIPKKLGKLDYSL